MMVRTSAPGRFAHVVSHFFPMLLLGIIILVIGLSPHPPRIGVLDLGDMFAVVGLVLIVGATLGILFTKCPKCYQSWRVMCLTEPDVKSDPETGEYYRDLLAEDITGD